VDGADGSDEAKQRLRAILRTLSGELSVSEACAQLGVSEPHFHRLRRDALTGAAEALEPRPAGRPAQQLDERDLQVAELEDKLGELTLELRASQVREQIAVLMPHLLQPAGGSKKKRGRRR
jgi:transposase-like protein